MDVNSGEVMQSNNMHARLPVASLTKNMTALLAAESGKLDAVVVVPPCAVAVEPRNIWLSPGENITLRNLVYGLLLRSGNDAALAIAYFLAGGVDAFAAKMNERAKELGAVGVKRIRHSLLTGLLADLAGLAAAIIVCRHLFGAG